jgi:hypothetical protein
LKFPIVSVLPQPRTSYEDVKRRSRPGQTAAGEFGGGKSGDHQRKVGRCVGSAQLYYLLFMSCVSIDISWWVHTVRCMLLHQTSCIEPCFKSVFKKLKITCIQKTVFIFII